MNEWVRFCRAQTTAEAESACFGSCLLQLLARLLGVTTYLNLPFLFAFSLSLIFSFSSLPLSPEE
ncbi:hypothetical protein ASPTUDRAFT_278020 [Aspergillus tubingensis CBS 134.48]|uniref:Uncharacterized protein n=1 Tax=Aspergillus tubingensis (strain CBS 134.48) TaxID=767770 RepID=A0A1L9NPB3_ASPTC|nr:hypothetical protein ASPTUDRAFT_278020 [Aspergillus tubingensis CBS 134.48]